MSRFLGIALVVLVFGMQLGAVARGGQWGGGSASPAATQSGAVAGRLDERTRIMRTVRRIHLVSRSTADLLGIDTAPLMANLLKETEFQNGTWQLVNSPTNADLTIELNRVPWTWDFTYSILHPPSGLVFGGGKVIAWDGVRAASGLAKKIIKDLRAMRAAAAANPPAKPSSPDTIQTPQETDAQPPQAELEAQPPAAPGGGSVRVAPVSAPPPAPLPAPPASSAGRPVKADPGAFVLRVEVQLVVVDAVVQGPGGIEPTGALSSLTKNDFHVLEDGRDQPIQHFSRDQLPLAVALVVDTSGSVAPYIDELRQAALEALAQLKPVDRVTLFCFTDSPQRVVDLTSDTRQVAQSIQRIHAAGGTNILDALMDAVSYLRTEAPAQRRVVILVSDNVATVGSLLSQADFVRKALEAETVVYSIQTPGERMGQAVGQACNVEEIAKETGGEVIAARRAGSVSAALAAVVKRLKTRYTLGYYPANKGHDGTFHVIEVRLGDRFGMPLVDYTIFARRGYYSPRAGG